VVAAEDWAPDRGEAVWISLDPRLGHEQAGRRPAVVLSPRAYNEKVGLAVLCPVTTSSKGYPFEVHLPDDLPVRGVVLADQVKSLDWRARRAERIAALPNDLVVEILQKLAPLIGT
jgi:mRNA interferase MazF